MNDDLQRCDYCNELKRWSWEKTDFVDFGFSVRKKRICVDCDKDEHSEFDGDSILCTSGQSNRAFDAICQTIRNLSIDASLHGDGSVNYYDAVKHAFDTDTPLHEFLEMLGVESSDRIDKNMRAIWEFTNYVVRGMEPRITVVNKDPDNFRVSWNE